MILIIDSIANVSSEATIVLSGGTMPWVDLPQIMQGQGPADAWRYLNFGTRWFECVIKPIQPPGASDLPSTIAARSFAADRRSSQELVGLAPSFPDEPELPAHKYGFVAFPQKWDLPEGIPPPCSLDIVSPNGSVLLNSIDLVAYTSIDPAPKRGFFPSLRLDDTRFLNGVAGDPHNLIQPVSYALRVSNMLLDRTPTRDEAKAIHRAMGVDPAMPLDPSMPPIKTQTLLLHDQGPLYDILTTRDGHQVSVPTSPLYHVSLLAGSSLTPFHRGLTDFHAIEMQYEREIERELMIRRNAAYQSFRIAMLDLLTIGIGANLDIPGWLKIPLNGVLSEMKDDIQKNPTVGS